MYDNVCMFVKIYIYIYIHTHTCACIYIYTTMEEKCLVFYLFIYDCFSLMGFIR